MEYTKNYHLPQWVKSDRIMMDDFNAAMVGIEEGISAERTGLLRAAYNLYQVAAVSDQIPVENGMFVQKLGGKTLPGNVRNMVACDDYCWIARGERELTGVDLKAYFTIDQQMKVVKGDVAAGVPLIATFHPPAPGQITRVIIRGNYNSCDSKAATFRVRFTNLSTGECDDVVCNAVLLSGNIGAAEPVLDEVNLQFHMGVSYRLEVIPLDATFNGAFELGAQKVTMHMMTSTARLSKTFDSEEAGTDAIALIQYGTYGNGGTLEFTWGGQSPAPHRTRTFKDGKGRTVQELEFHRSGGAPRRSYMGLEITCPPGGEVCIYNWGAVLI